MRLIKTIGPVRAVLAALAVVAFVWPAHADLLLPEQGTESARRELWLHVFQSIPAGLRPTRDVQVREVSDKEMEDLVRDDPDQASKGDDSIVDGIFFIDDKQPTITLRRSLKGEEAKQVFAHELGHLVWDTFLDGGDRREYSGVYRRAKAAKHLVSEYAEDSLDEGFAEAFSFYVVKPETLRTRDPLSFDELDKLTAKRTKEHGD